MKKTFFSFVLALMVSVAFSQSTTTNYSFKSTIPNPLFITGKTNPTDVLSIEMLAKNAWVNYIDTDKINLSPKNFSKHSETRKIESYKNMILNNSKQDVCGRDIPMDVIYDVTQKTYFRGLSDR